MTRTKANLDVRECAKKAGVYLWEIAAAIGVSEPTFNRRMRVEMPESEKEQVKAVINRLETEQSGGAAV
ncbi:MAG: hypothetical protein NC253_14320 [Ruminococcus sp.]|nr:hypothetical protein [Ruminococcus sp.]MCM1381683.1 hypothetical protein [Muribaculaceae bacterium]MCM1480468.1 hypothetical protein [Muribaculaceae bacterium]